MNEFDIEGLAGGPFGTNAYLVTDGATRKCAIVDPGYEADRVWLPILEARGLTLEKILCTHGHIDHVTGVAPLLRVRPGTPVLIHAEDEFLLAGGNAQSAAFLGLPPYEPARPTDYLVEGAPVGVGRTEFQVFHVPGHCPGHVALYHHPHLISGDVIFAGSIGRTDLPGGNYPLLAASIVEKLLSLGNDVIVYPGHGPMTTLGEERRSNPFILEMLRERRRREGP